MPEYINDCVQGDERWFRLRLASIGSSGISKAVAKGAGKVRTAYLFKKAYELLTGNIPESYSNEAMQLGTDSEPLSRDLYSFEKDVEVEQVAIIKEGPHKHASVDGCVGENGIIEIKNTNGPNYIEIISKGKVPTEHLNQINWELFISQREWCDYIQAHWIRRNGEIVAGYPEKPIWIKRVERDEKLIKELNEGADKFIAEMLEIVERIKS